MIMADPTGSAATAPLRIVIAEDSRTQATWLAYTLRQQGHQVSVAADGVAALELLGGDLPDLVISDIQMPRMDGYELCRAIKSNPATAGLLVMLATSQKEPATIVRGLASGADNFLTKPLDDQSLRMRIAQMAAWKNLESDAAPSDHIPVDFNGEFYSIPADPRRSIHFLLSAVQETEKRRHQLEEATHRAEEALKQISELEAGLRQLIEHGAVAMCVVGPDGLIRYANLAAGELFDKLATELTGTRFPFPVDGSSESVSMARPDGSSRACEMQLSPTPWYGEPCLLASLWDVTEDVQLRDALRTLSLTDELTGLYNRRGFMTLAEPQLLRELRRHTRTRGVALLFADIDDMKEINDVHGHDAGDEALVEVAGLLRSACRQGDILARLGGDEFAAILVDCDQGIEAAVRTRLEGAIRERNEISRAPYRLAVSVGGAQLTPENPGTLEDLLREADQDMYRVKAKRKGCGRPQT